MKDILIVDDTPLQAIMLRRVLERAGYKVTTAKNGKEALEFLKNNKYALVISDVNMPEMNGFELCHAIKTTPSLSSIPVILCTMLSDPADLIKGIEAGADNYITRPWDDERLLILVDNLLKMATGPKTRYSNGGSGLWKYRLQNQHEQAVHFEFSPLYLRTCASTKCAVKST